MRILLTLVVGCFLVLPFAAACVPGDVNCNGNVDLTDLMLIVQDIGNQFLQKTVVRKV